MKYTVFTPCYNSAKHIEQTIQSVLNQNCSDWEHFLIDDESKDNTFEVIQRYSMADPRIRAITQKNSGVSVTRNRGFAEARGEWIVSLDHDDALLPDALDRIDRLISSFPSAECIVFPYSTKDSADRIQAHRAPVFRDFGDQCYPGTEAFRLLYSDKRYRDQHLQPWRFVFRANHCPHFRKGVIHEDMDALPFHIASLRNVCIAKDPVYLYTDDNPQSVTSFFSPRRVKDICEVTSRLYQTMDQIAAGNSSIKLSQDVLKGFKSMLAFNLFGFYLASDTFPEPDRSNCLSFFEEHPDWLMAIDFPSASAPLKRMLLRLLGVRGFARLVNTIRRKKAS